MTLLKNSKPMAPLLSGIFAVLSLVLLTLNMTMNMRNGSSSTSWFATDIDIDIDIASSWSSLKRSRSLRSLSFVSSDPKSVVGKKEMNTQSQQTIYFVIQIFNDDGLDLIPVQLSNLKWFIANAIIEYHVVVAQAPSGDDFTERANSVLSSLVGSSNVHTCTSGALVQCMNYAFSDVIPSLPKNNNMLMHANVDMFLVRHWDPFDYMARIGNPGISAVIENHVWQSAPYLHPGLFVVDLGKVPNLEEMRFDTRSDILRGDLGAITPHFLLSHPDITVKPMVWSRKIGFQLLVKRGLISDFVYSTFLVRFMNEFQISSSLAPDLYTRDFAWIHFRDLSCWSGCTGGSKHDFLQRMLPLFLQESKRGAKNAQPSNAKQPLCETDFSCWGCATTTTGLPPPLTSSGNLLVSLKPANISATFQTERIITFV